MTSRRRTNPSKPMNFPFLTNRQIEREAELLRIEALRQRAEDVPVDLDAIVFDHLCELEGLILADDQVLADEDGDEVLGMLEIGPGRIHINASLTSDRGRYRFTLAHEIGHWRLHRPLLLAEAAQPSLFGSAQPDSGPLKTLNRSIVTINPPRHEIQANRFAANLLVSAAALACEVGKRFGSSGPAEALNKVEDHSIRERGRYLAALSAEGHPALAATFGISLEAMAIALEVRGYLDTAPRLL